MKTVVSFKKYIVSILASLSFTLIILVILSAVQTFFSVNKAITSYSPTVLFFVSSFLSGFLSARKTNKGGIITGAVAAFFYSILILLLAIVFSFNSVTLSGALKTVLYSLPFGIIGGILGINV